MLFSGSFQHASHSALPPRNPDAWESPRRFTSREDVPQQVQVSVFIHRPPSPSRPRCPPGRWSRPPPPIPLLPPNPCSPHAKAHGCPPGSLHPGRMPYSHGSGGGKGYTPVEYFPPLPWGRAPMQFPRQPRKVGHRCPSVPPSPEARTPQCRMAPQRNRTLAILSRPESPWHESCTGLGHDRRKTGTV